MRDTTRFKEWIAEKKNRQHFLNSNQWLISERHLKKAGEYSVRNVESIATKMSMVVRNVHRIIYSKYLLGIFKGKEISDDVTAIFHTPLNVNKVLTRCK